MLFSFHFNLGRLCPRGTALTSQADHNSLVMFLCVSAGCGVSDQELWTDALPAAHRTTRTPQLRYASGEYTHTQTHTYTPARTHTLTLSSQCSLLYPLLFPLFFLLKLPLCFAVYLSLHILIL